MGKASRDAATYPLPAERDSLNTMAHWIWAILAFPFRLIGWIVELCGRAVGAVMGFVLMVLGVALAAGPLFPIGVPLFIVGLILMLRSLG